MDVSFHGSDVFLVPDAISKSFDFIDCFHHHHNDHHNNDLQQHCSLTSSFRNVKEYCVFGKDVFISLWEKSNGVDDHHHDHHYDYHNDDYHGRLRPIPCSTKDVALPSSSSLSSLMSLPASSSSSSSSLNEDTWICMKSRCRKENR